jgi:hypothetical protein
MHEEPEPDPPSRAGRDERQDRTPEVTELRDQRGNGIGHISSVHDALSFLCLTVAKRGPDELPAPERRIAG